MLAGEDDDDEVTLAGITPAGGEEPQDPQMKLSRAIQTLNVEGVLELLTSNTVDVNKRDARGFHPLHTAAIAGDETILRLLMDAGAADAINVRDNGGFTPLHYACSEGWDDCVSMLLESPNIDINATTEDFACYIAASIPMYMTGGRTPLHYAVDKGEKQCVELLLAYGADKSIKDYDDNTPYDLALLHKNPDIAALLVPEPDAPVELPKEAVEAKKHADQQKRSLRIGRQEKVKSDQEKALINKYLDIRFGDNACVVPAEEGKHAGTFIFLHGMGDTGSGWVLRMLELHKKLPHFKSVLPTAQKMFVTSLKGKEATSWHDVIKGRDKIDEEECLGIQDSRKFVELLIEHELSSNVIDHSKIVIGGFSQGAALAAFTTYQYPKALAGAVLLSGYLPFYDTFDRLITEPAKTTPALICHGSGDEVITLDKGKRVGDVLNKLGVPVTLSIFAGQGHNSSNEEMDVIESFLRSVLPAA